MDNYIFNFFYFIILQLIILRLTYDLHYIIMYYHTTLILNKTTIITFMDNY